jgi:hypothetical protein
VQTLTCTCTGTCTGTITLKFDGEETGSLAYNAATTDLDTALEVSPLLVIWHNPTTVGHTVDPTQREVTSTHIPPVDANTASHVSSLFICFVVVQALSNVDAGSVVVTTDGSQLCDSTTVTTSITFTPTSSITGNLPKLEVLSSLAGTASDVTITSSE